MYLWDGLQYDLHAEYHHLGMDDFIARHDFPLAMFLYRRVSTQPLRCLTFTSGPPIGSSSRSLLNLPLGGITPFFQTHPKSNMFIYVYTGYFPRYIPNSPRKVVAFI